MIDFISKERYNYEDFVNVIEILRAPGGCPWDREQTHQSIARNFLEEVYEFLEAMEQDDPEHMCEELGDVLTQVVFHCNMEQEAGRFTQEDVCDMVCKKMIFRHPHVFGTVEVADSDEVLTNWDTLKMEEKHQQSYGDTLQAVAKNLPSTWRAEKLVKKASKAGFVWDDLPQATAKIQEEVTELTQSMDDPAEELGDVLFATVSAAFVAGLDPEELLHQACEKFTRRFVEMEQSATEPLDKLSKSQLLSLWNQKK
ncbi:MAG: nucleoside triphosphate pyrophosphohydrolase [Eubacteriales bacterium]